MTDTNLRNINPQTPVFTAFLGGVTFTVLALFIQFAKVLKFVDVLITLTAVISFLFILSTLGTMKPLVHKDFRDLMVAFVNLGIFGIMAIIPITILSFNYYGALVVFVLEVISVIIFNIVNKKNPNPRSFDHTNEPTVDTEKK